VKRRLAATPLPQAEALVANDDLRGFLKAVFRLHEDGRIPADEWTQIGSAAAGRIPLHSRCPVPDLQRSELATGLVRPAPQR